MRRSGLVHSILAVLAFSLLLLLCTPLQASPVSGNLAITGDATVGATFLTFLCDGLLMPCAANYGDFMVGGPASQTGSFSIYANDTGFIHSLDNTVQPLNTNFSLPDFLKFNPAGTVIPPDISLELTFIFLGVNGQAQCGSPANPNQVPAQTCTPQIAALISANNPMGLSPFNLANTQTGSTASFDVGGIAHRLSTGETSIFRGEFSATFTSTPNTTDKSYQALLATLSTGGTISSTYSATFAATIIPEPGTTALVLGGLLVLAGTSFRRRFSRLRR